MSAAPAGFLFDPNRCTGCAACSLACSTENALGWGASWRQIVPFNPERRPGLPSFHLSLACNHCDDAPCVAHCPTGAMRRDAVTGAVLVDEARCIGCRYCAWVCPYEAPRFDAARGVASKCTLCHHRLSAGQPPACVEACPTDALGYGLLAGEAGIPGFPETAVGPRIRFTLLRRGAVPPESTWSLPEEVLAVYGPAAVDAPRPARSAGIMPVALTFQGEWPLWLFTSGLTGLVGWIAAAFVSATGSVGEPTVRGGISASLGVFLGAAVLLVGLSTLHLGRPLLAWRAAANLRTSALGREVAGVAAFLGTAGLWLAWGGAGDPPLLPRAPAPPTLAALGAAGVALGLLAMAAVDRVYRPLRGGRAFDSADTVLTGPLLAAALLRSSWVFGALAAVKLGLALAARRRRGSAGAHVALRAAALTGPVLLWWVAPGAWGGWAVLLVAAAELTDRARFYRELSIPGPREIVRRDAARWITDPNAGPDA